MTASRVLGAVVVAVCGVALLTNVAYQFARVRIPLDVIQGNTSASISLPPIYHPENLLVAIDGVSESGELTHAYLHVPLAVPADRHVVRAELRNFRGFSQGLVSTVIVPAHASGFDRPSIWFVMGSAIVLTAAGLRRPWRSILGRRAYGTLAGIVLAVLAAIGIAPYISPYRVLVAPHTWMLSMAILYLPAVEPLLAPVFRRIASRDVVVLYASGLVILALLSSPRMVGDGPEYLGMADAFRS